MNDDFYAIFVRNRPRALVLAVLLIVLLAWLGNGGVASW